MPTPQFKPSHQPIKEYYAALDGYRGHDVSHELAVKTAFQRLLEVTARKHDWHLVPEQAATVRGKQVRGNLAVHSPSINSSSTSK